MNTELESRKQDLIHIIEWYRDEYFNQLGKKQASELIELIKVCQEEKVIENYEQRVDGWLD